MIKSFNHNKIERSQTRIWEKKILNEICKACADAGYSVIKTPDSITIGLRETDQVFLKSMKGTSGWLTRFDRKLFDENAQ